MIQMNAFHHLKCLNIFDLVCVIESISFEFVIYILAVVISLIPIGAEKRNYSQVT